MVCLFSVFVMSVLHPTLVAPSLQSSTLITTVTAYVTTCFGSPMLCNFAFSYAIWIALSIVAPWTMNRSCLNCSNSENLRDKTLLWLKKADRLPFTFRMLVDHLHYDLLHVSLLPGFLAEMFSCKVLKVWRSLEISAPPVQGCIECFLELVSHLYAWWRLKRLYMDNRFIVMIGWLWVTIARVWIQYIEKIWKDDKMMEDNVRWWKMMEDDWRKCCGGTSSAALLKQQGLLMIYVV